MALCLALLCSNYSNAQEVLTTGNLVNFTGTPTATTGNWVNGYYVDQLCFHAGEPGNCGPNPSIRAASGNINFSYGQVNLNQVVNINHALSEAGVGVQLSGFNFGFRAKNGNGWDDGRQDFLAAYVNIYNSGAKLLEHYDYTQSTNRKYNWSDFNFTETFNKPYDISKLGAAQFGFVGKDNNFWAGNYGPEIMNVSFSLNYRVDPCVANPASSPTCPGFGNLIKPPSMALSTPYLAITDSATTANSLVNVGGAQLSNTGTISAPDSIPQALKDIQAVAKESQKQESNKSTPNMSLMMNLLGQIQAADKATQTAAVQNANKIVSTSSANAQEQANQVVETLNTMSQTSSEVGRDQTGTQSFAIANQNAGQTNALSGQLQLPSTVTSPMNSTYSSNNNNFSLTNNQVTPQTETQQKSEYKQPEAETTVTFNNTPVTSTSVTDLFANKLNIESTQKEQTTETLNRNVEPNDLAGSVDIASIAIAPKGYEAYGFVLQDAAFYKVEAIYKDQKTVDNARAFRSLSNDRLHQEMVDQQYKEK